MAARVGYQGEPGAYSEGAALEAFKPTGLQIEPVGHASFEEVFQALASGAVEYAAVPVENTLGGSIHVNYDLMLRFSGKVHVLGEHSFRVRHTLLALPGVKKADVKKAMSHPQALAQTEGYLKGAGIQAVPAYDTAGSAKMVREQGLRDTAAIASARAAEVHGLEVLDFGIEDDANNYTRFLILGREAVTVPEDMPAKTSIVFVPKANVVGVLHKMLSCFAQRDIGKRHPSPPPHRPSNRPHPRRHVCPTTPPP
jgi:prephenate dehydratase